MRSWLIILLSVLLLGQTIAVAESHDDKHVEVSMRMIGHQMLLSLGDSTSRVLPIEKENGSYRIRFATEFAFNPDQLTNVIDSVVKATSIATRYNIAFQNCASKETVHMFEMSVMPQNNVLACRSRDQPFGCYELVFTIIDPVVSQPELAETPVTLRQFGSSEYRNIHKLLLILVALVVGLIAFILFLLRSRTEQNEDPDGVRIGAFLFNSRKMELSFAGEQIELTSKESDLLQLLFASANDTVDRETILKTVWGDDGDYVGRTLDVFVSKLRKKLEADPNVKIANIRGVGYRLVVDGRH